MSQNDGLPFWDGEILRKTDIERQNILWPYCYPVFEPYPCWFLCDSQEWKDFFRMLFPCIRPTRSFVYDSFRNFNSSAFFTISITPQEPASADSLTVWRCFKWQEEGCRILNKFGSCMFHSLMIFEYIWWVLGGGFLPSGSHEHPRGLLDAVINPQLYPQKRFIPEMNLPTSQVRICLSKTLEVDTLFQLRAYSSNAKKGAQHSQIICVCSSWENSALQQEGPSPMIHQRPTYMILIYFDDWQQLRLHGLAMSCGLGSI